MRIASIAFVASASALSTAKRRLTRRDVGGAVALTTLAPLTARADVKIDPNSVRTTKGGAKYVVVKEGACPLIDPSGALGSCYPVWKSTSVSGARDDSSQSHFLTMTRPCWLRRAMRNRHRHAIERVDGVRRVATI